LSLAAESLQEESGQSWFETHEKLSDETADLSLLIKGLAEKVG
jgi:hypothetical protein